ncbi:MAG: hypothetical protein ACRYFX_12070 [Janthinobacterium lividum]
MTLPPDAQPGDCYEFYLVSYDNEGVQVVHDHIGTLCAGGIPGINTGTTWGTSWGGGGGGGGGASSTQPKTPCAALTRDGQNAQTLAQMNQLKAQLNDNKEHGVATYYGVNGAPTFTSVTGTAGQLGIFNWGISAGVASIIHTHYSDPGSLSVFSEGDLQSLYILYNSGNIANVSTFTTTIITASGTVYSLAITNPTAFANFGNTYDLSNLNSQLIGGQYTAYHITSTSTVTDNERWFVKMLSLLDTGLTLYKGDPNNFASWQKLTYANGTATTSPCN